MVLGINVRSYVDVKIRVPPAYAWRHTLVDCMLLMVHTCVATMKRKVTEGTASPHTKYLSS